MLTSSALDMTGANDRGAIEAAAFALSLRARGFRNTAILGAMERVPRELFAPRRFRDLARTDVALPLRCGQTMTAPSVVATMLLALGASPGQRALEIGTGSGYVTALLARLGCKVRSVERFSTLAEEAAARFRISGVDDAVALTVGNGLDPNLVEGRFERILVNGAIPAAPAWLTSLLLPGGRLVGAVMVDGFARLSTIERSPDGPLRQELGGAIRLGPLVCGSPTSL